LICFDALPPAGGGGAAGGALLAGAFFAGPPPLEAPTVGAGVGSLSCARRFRTSAVAASRSFLVLLNFCRHDSASLCVRSRVHGQM